MACTENIRVAYDQTLRRDRASGGLTMPAQSPVSTDPVLETQVFWERFKAPILAGLVLILIAGAGYAGYRIYADRRETQAAETLAAAKTPPDYQQVIDRFGGTAASANAYLFLAESQRSAGKFADANATLQAFINKFPKHELITTAWMAIAANLESLGKPDDALATYQRLAANYPQSFNAPLAMISQVHLLKAKGQLEEARRVCETVLTQYRDSAISGEASRQLRLLKPKTPAQAPTTPQGSPTAQQPPGAKPATVNAVVSPVPSAHP
jgi:TolA-binding protein